MGDGAQLVVGGYPHLLSDAAGDYPHGSCTPSTSPVQHLNQADAVWINQITDVGNSTIRAAIQSANQALMRSGRHVSIEYADPVPEFYGHGVCSGIKSFINPVLVPRVDITKAAQQSFHPNVSGEQAYLAAFVCALDNNCPSSAVTGTQLNANVGATVQTQAGGFAPGEAVSATLHSVR